MSSITQGGVGEGQIVGRVESQTLEEQLERCNREIARCFNDFDKHADNTIGWVDWLAERDFIMTEQLVQDAMRTEPDYTFACERLQDKNLVRLLHVAMGLATEAGEFVDALKRHIFYGTPIDNINLIEELGDTSWYQRIGCNALDVEFMVMLSRNVEKLRKRYPEKFTERQAVKRDWAAERQALENNID